MTLDFAADDATSITTDATTQTATYDATFYEIRHATYYALRATLIAFRDATNFIIHNATAPQVSPTHLDNWILTS